MRFGYAGTTTTKVCGRAGVSQGALFKHFASKTALLAATVEHLFAQLVDDFRRGFAAIAQQDDRVAAAVHALAAIFRQLELSYLVSVDAAGDPEAVGARVREIVSERLGLL